MVTLGILAISTRIYAQVSDDDLIDSSKTNTPIVYPMEVYPVGVAEIIAIEEKVYETVPVSIEYSPDTSGRIGVNLVPYSIADRAAWNPSTNFGFSLGANEGYYISETSYENQFLDSTNRKQSSSGTSLSAKVFTNYAHGKTAMHFDYNANYSFYPGKRKTTDDIDHEVRAIYTRSLNNRASFQLRDSFTSSSNDPLKDIFSMSSSFELGWMDPSFFNIIFVQQTSNSVSAQFDTDITGKGTNVNFSGSYSNTWYGGQDSTIIAFNDYYSSTLGVGLSQRITNWMSLGSSYHIQLNNNLNDSMVHNVGIGGFKFNLSPDVVVNASVGIYITDAGIAEDYSVGLTTRAEISYTVENGNLFAGYSRGMTYANIINKMLPTDAVSVGLGVPIGSRTNLRGMWMYDRISESYDSRVLSKYRYFASMEVILARGLFSSISYTYQTQKSAIDSLLDIPHGKRSTFSGGLTYYWPSRGSR